MSQNSFGCDMHIVLYLFKVWHINFYPFHIISFACQCMALLWSTLLCFFGVTEFIICTVLYIRNTVYTLYAQIVYAMYKITILYHTILWKTVYEIYEETTSRSGTIFLWTCIGLVVLVRLLELLAADLSSNMSEENLGFCYPTITVIW